MDLNLYQKSLQKFCEQIKVNIQYIQPGHPSQNAYTEGFNRTYREDVLDAYHFTSIFPTGHFME